MSKFGSKILRFLLGVFLLATLAPVNPVKAQDEMPVYVVQSGDTLSQLGQLFHTPTNSLILTNNITDPDNLKPGMKLKIPSLEGFSGVLLRSPLPVGMNAHILSRKLGMTDEEFDRLNFITSPDTLAVKGETLMLQQEDRTQIRLPLTAGQTDLELAVRYGLNPWTASESNHLAGPWDLLANDTLYLPADSANVYEALLPGVTALDFSRLPLAQGQTTLITAKADNGVALSGSLLGSTLTFYPDASGNPSVYAGVQRMTTPGIQTMILTSTAADGSVFSLQQNLPLVRADYGYETPLTVSDQTVDPAVTVPEADKITALVTPVTAEKYWSGAFVSPSPTPDCRTSTYGRLRSFNGSDYIYFHSGIDFCGGESTPVFAAADGVVVFTGLLTVRGNATIIDHGRGVYTGYYHQSQILVNVGDRVQAGEKIGMVGATGRVTGPHLHFEVFVSTAQVDPDDWLDGKYP